MLRCAVGHEASALYRGAPRAPLKTRESSFRAREAREKLRPPYVTKLKESSKTALFTTSAGIPMDARLSTLPA